MLLIMSDGYELAWNTGTNHQLSLLRLACHHTKSNTGLLFFILFLNFAINVHRNIKSEAVEEKSQSSLCTNSLIQEE